jgi:hypothetical protein
VVVREVELSGRLVAPANVRVAAVPVSPYLPLWWKLSSARHLRRKIMDDCRLGVKKLPCRVPVLDVPDLYGYLLGAVHWVVVEQPLPFDLAYSFLELLEPSEVAQSFAEVEEVHVSEKVGLLVVKDLQEPPISVRVFLCQTYNHIWDLRVVSHVSAQTPGALQDETGKPPSLVLHHHDDGFFMGGFASGLGLVDFCLPLVHQGERVPARELLRAPDYHAVEGIPDNGVGVLGDTWELYLLTQLGALNLGDQYLERCLLVCSFCSVLFCLFCLFC